MSTDDINIQYPAHSDHCAEDPWSKTDANFFTFTHFVVLQLERILYGVS